MTPAPTSLIDRAGLDRKKVSTIISRGLEGAYARAKDPRVRQVTVSLGASWQVVEILRADGEVYRDVRPLVRLNVSIVAGDGARQESGSHGYGGREGYERFIETRAWRDATDD